MYALAGMAGLGLIKVYALYMNWQDVFSAMLEQGPSEASASMYVYARIVETLKTAIEDGRMKVGDRLPTIRELAAFLKVDRSTVARSYLGLAQLGFIASQVGRGTFVSSSSVASSNSSIASSLAPQLPSG